MAKEQIVEIIDENGEVEEIKEAKKKDRKKILPKVKTFMAKTGKFVVLGVVAVGTIGYFLVKGLAKDETKTDEDILKEYMPDIPNFENIEDDSLAVSEDNEVVEE